MRIRRRGPRTSSSSIPARPPTKRAITKKRWRSFSQALLSPDTDLQANSHYNLGNTLYQRGEEQKSDNKKLSNWT